MCAGTSQALQVRFQRRAASPPIGGTAANADCHELLVEDPVHTNAVLASLLIRGERGGSVEPDNGWGLDGGGPEGGGVKQHGGGGGREVSRSERRRAKRRDGERRRDGDASERSKSRRHGGNAHDRRAQDGGSRPGECSRSDIGGDSGNDDRKEKGRSASKHHKHRSRHDKRKRSRRDSPEDSRELKEALGYLIEQGVDVTEMVKEMRG